MRRKYFNVILFIFLNVILLNSPLQASEKEIFRETFDNMTALKDWNVHNVDIEIVPRQNKKDGYCVKIHRDSRDTVF